MGQKVNYWYGPFIGIGVVAAAVATVYFVSTGYVNYQQQQHYLNQNDQKIGVPVSAIELPPSNISSSDAQGDPAHTDSPAQSTTHTLTPTVSLTGSGTPSGTSTPAVTIATNTPTPTSLLPPTATPTPSETLLVNSPTPSPTQPASTPTAIPPTSTNTVIPTIDPRLCKVEPEETRHPHYCTPTPGS